LRGIASIVKQSRFIDRLTGLIHYGLSREMSYSRRVASGALSMHYRAYRTWLIYALLCLACAVYFFSNFLLIPIGTEARDYVFYRGFMAASHVGSALFYPVGANRRIVSMFAFALWRGACGLNAPCLNSIQIVELMLCMGAGALHLHQLLRRPVLVALSLAAWAISLPVFSAAYWQATQHDKLAFLFSLLALSLGHWAIGRNASIYFRLATGMLIALLFLLALNSKEIAFFLPAAVTAQIALFVPARDLRTWYRAASVYILPMVYCGFYISVYLLRLNGAWRGHVLSGNAVAGLAYYAGSLAGRHADPSAALTALGILLAGTIFLGLRSMVVEHRSSLSSVLAPASQAPKAFTYLMVIFVANLTLVAKAQYPDNFYLLIGAWAFFGWIATGFDIAQRSRGIVQYPIFAVILLIGVIIARNRIVDLTNAWGSGRLLYEAHAIERGYRQLHQFCGPQMRGGVKLVFPERPLGSFFFFRGGDERPDQLVGAFICNDGTAPVINYRFDGIARPDHPGQLLVAWDSNLRLKSVMLDGRSLAAGESPPSVFP